MSIAPDTAPPRPDPPVHNMQEWYEQLKSERIEAVERKRKRGGFLFMGLALLLLPGILLGANRWIGYSVGGSATPVSTPNVRIFAAQQADDTADLYLKAWLALNLKDDPVRMQTFNSVVIPSVYRNYKCMPATGIEPYIVKPSEAKYHARLVERAFIQWRHQGLVPGHAEEGRWHTTMVFRCQPPPIG